MSTSSVSHCLITLAICIAASLFGCRQQAPVDQQEKGKESASVAGGDVAAKPVKRGRRQSKYPKTLSEYKLFEGELVNHTPARGVVKYDLNSPLFTDYAAKQRFVRLPEGETVPYNPDDVLDFPVGTVIAKTFAHDNDMNDPAKGTRMIETRILKREAAGWIGLPYVWNDEQTEANLELTGATREVSWVHYDGEQRTISHLVPNVNDCKRCHVENEPIGPQTRHLNREFAYKDGSENQLAHWSRIGMLTGAPKPDEAPRLADWDDESSGTVDQRARAWLEINCAHCHSPTGPARNSGLHLHASVTDPFRLGVYKGPVAAGKGTGGRSYDIVPGKPEDSILMYRLETTHSGEVMPEFGRSVVDVEANELIRQWISEMKDPNRESASTTGHHGTLSLR